MFTALASLALLTAVQDPAAIRVSYADLNLATAAGQVELDRRIARAVEAVCPTPDLRVIRDVMAADACRATAQARVAEQRQVALATARPVVQIGSITR